MSTGQPLSRASASKRVAQHRRKFIGWCGFYVALPLLVYPAAALIALFSGFPFSFQDALVKGDLLFLVVVLLATTVDWTVMDYLLTPGREAAKRWKDYVFFMVALLALLFYTMLYGWLITTRMEGGPQVANPTWFAMFTAFSLVGWVWYCGAMCFHLINKGRI